MSDVHIKGGNEVKGVVPKFYIKDEGTDYNTGEEYNGLWSTGTPFNPSGYADIGHWRLLERKGRVAFNGRSRGNNDILIQGARWSTNSIGTYLQYKIPKFGLTNPSVNHWMMIGTGGGYNEQLQWGQFVRHPGFDNLLSISGPRKLRYHFDMWAWFNSPPEAGEIQVLFSLQRSTPGGANTGRVLRFCVENISGTLYLSLYIFNTITQDLSFVRSSTAAQKIYPNGSLDGGLHWVSFLLDVDQQVSNQVVFSNPLVESDEGFYVDGTQMMVTNGSTDDWVKSSISIDMNPLIGCETAQSNITFQNDKKLASPNFHRHFTGKIYAVQMNSIGDVGTIDKKRLNTIYNLKFNIPRGPSYIDLSERFEYGGKNLLKELSSIDQIIEDEGGNFYVTLQNIRAKN